jgi:hypothetical protein
MTRGPGLALGAGALAVVALAAFFAPRGLARGEAVGQRATVTYHDRHRCGVVVADYLAPRTHLRADLDGDGEVEHYVGTWGGVERHRVQPGSHPPTLVRDAVVYTSTQNHQYSCVDLAAGDVDRDGDLDVVFGAHSELVVLRNDAGRLVVARREPQSFSPEADVRIRVAGESVSLVEQ